MISTEFNQIFQQYGFWGGLAIVTLALFLPRLIGLFNKQTDNQTIELTNQRTLINGIIDEHKNMMLRLQNQDLLISILKTEKQTQGETIAKLQNEVNELRAKLEADEMAHRALEDTHVKAKAEIVELRAKLAAAENKLTVYEALHVKALQTVKDEIPKHEPTPITVIPIVPIVPIVESVTPASEVKA